MKNKILLPLIAIIFLSSCANKFSLTKRKYTKGYYFASSKNSSSAKTENEHKNLAVKTLPVKHATLLAETNSSPEIKNVSNNEVLTLAKLATPSKEQKSAKSNLIASVNSENNYATAIAVKPVVKKQNHLANAYKKGSSDTNLIILIILCLFPFICLIPIYIHDGKSITLNFWIDLLLHLTFIGEIIFALLVVLDIIDLG